MVQLFITCITHETKNVCAWKITACSRPGYFYGWSNFSGVCFNLPMGVSVFMNLFFVEILSGNSLSAYRKSSYMIFLCTTSAMEEEALTYFSFQRCRKLYYFAWNAKHGCSEYPPSTFTDLANWTFSCSSTKFLRASSAKHFKYLNPRGVQRQCTEVTTQFDGCIQTLTVLQ